MKLVSPGPTRLASLQDPDAAGERPCGGLGAAGAGDGDVAVLHAGHADAGGLTLKVEHQMSARPLMDEPKLKSVAAPLTVRGIMIFGSLVDQRLRAPHALGAGLLARLALGIRRRWSRRRPQTARGLGCARLSRQGSAKARQGA